MKIVFKIDQPIETVLSAFDSFPRKLQWYDDTVVINMETNVSMRDIAKIVVSLTCNVESVVLVEEEENKIVEIKWSSDYGQLVEQTTLTALVF